MHSVNTQPWRNHVLLILSLGSCCFLQKSPGSLKCGVQDPLYIAGQEMKSKGFCPCLTQRTSNSNHSLASGELCVVNHKISRKDVTTARLFVHATDKSPYLKKKVVGNSVALCLQMLCVRKCFVPVCNIPI